MWIPAVAETAGRGSVKEGAHYAHARASVLEQVMALQVHDLASDHVKR